MHVHVGVQQQIVVGGGGEKSRPKVRLHVIIVVLVHRAGSDGAQPPYRERVLRPGIWAGVIMRIQLPHPVEFQREVRVGRLHRETSLSGCDKRPGLGRRGDIFRRARSRLLSRGQGRFLNISLMLRLQLLHPGVQGFNLLLQRRDGVGRIVRLGRTGNKLRADHRHHDPCLALDHSHFWFRRNLWKQSRSAVIIRKNPLRWDAL